MEFTKSEAKQWAKKHFEGVQTSVLPSFTPDLAELDEEGIRFDVRHLAKLGYFSLSLAMWSCAMTLEERKKFMEIVCDEAKGKVLVSIYMVMDTVEQDVEILKHFERVGGHSALLGYPAQFYPRSEEDIYQVTKLYCDSANLAMILYPSQKFDFIRLHPSYFPLGILEPLADIENVVALKITMFADPGLFAECFRLIGDRLLINEASPHYWPIAIPRYGVQWAGCGPYPPPYITLFNLLRKGDLDKAMDLFWKLYPIMMTTPAVQMGAEGLYHFTMWKYLQWCCGGNGGMLRQPLMKLNEMMKIGIKGAVSAVGITPPESEEEFYVGKVNYGKGARLTDAAKLLAGHG